MRAKLYHIALFGLLILPHLGWSQNIPRPEIQLDEFIQKIAAVQTEDINYEDLYEALLLFYLNPLDINLANADELRSLNLLSELQIQKIVEHRNKFGNFLSLYELQTVDELDPQHIKLLLPFVTISNRLSTSDISDIFSRATDHFLVLRTEQTLEQARGYTDSSFLGSPQKLYARYRLQHPKDFSLGFIMEKDQGEPNIADYTTFHFQLQNKGHFKNIILGDYHLQFGQGLILSGGYAAGKGSEPIYTSRRSDLGIRAHNSVLEGGFLRGAAASYQWQKLTLTGFASHTKRDASLNTEVDEREDVFSSLLISGLHRTENEIAKKGNIAETNYGMNVKMQLNGGHIGFTVLETDFSNTLKRNPAAYTAFEFVGKKNLVIGPNFSYSWQNFNFYGEAARSSSGGMGALGGFVASLSPKFEWAMQIRNYDKDFHSFYCNAFGEGTRTINEKGLYTGVKYSPKRGYTFAAFYDKFKFPWLRYLVDGPSEGNDYLFRFTLNPTRKWIFYTQIHKEQKQRNFPNNETISDYLVNSHRQNVLTHFEYSINRTFKTQTRFRYNTFRYETLPSSKGYAIIQDLEGSIGKLQLKGRLAYFYTDDYNSRIYAYENDVLYTVSFPAYYGKGTRVYLVSRYSLSRRIDLWLRYARTSLEEVDQISSGINTIPFPHKSDVKLQVRYRL